MQWNIRQPFGRPTVLDRLLLRRAALKYAAHGWAVTPGACLTGDRYACDRPGCPIMGCHPAIESWEDDASTEPDRVAHWWRERPHAVLLATGEAFDVLEVPATMGLRVLGTARLTGTAACGPVAVTPDERWMFLVRPGAGLRPELARCPDVVRHGHGSWIPAAPSRTPDGTVRWAVSPEEVHWRLPDSRRIQEMLVAALDDPARRPVTAVVPRQLSTSRRAA